MSDAVDITIGEAGGGGQERTPRDVAVPFQSIADGITVIANAARKAGTPFVGLGGQESTIIRQALRTLGQVGAGPSGARGGLANLAQIAGIPSAAGGGAKKPLTLLEGAKKLFGITARTITAGGAAAGEAVLGSMRDEFLQSTAIMARIMVADSLGISRKGVILGSPLRSKGDSDARFRMKGSAYSKRMRQAIEFTQKQAANAARFAEAGISTMMGVGFSGSPTTQPASTLGRGGPAGTSPFQYKKSISDIIEEQNRLDAIRKGGEEARRKLEGIRRRGGNLTTQPGFEIDYADPEIEGQIRRNEEINRQRTTSQPTSEPISSIRTMDHYADWMSQPPVQIERTIRPTYWPTVVNWIT